MTGSDGGERRVFRSYTQALRHPTLVGRIAEWRLPWILSVTQLGAMTTTAFLLVATRAVWAHFGGVVNLVVFAGVVVAVGWAVRRWRIEGRSPVAVVLGLVVAITRRGGTRNGRRLRRHGGVTPWSGRLVVTPAPRSDSRREGDRG